MIRWRSSYAGLPLPSHRREDQGGRSVALVDIVARHRIARGGERPGGAGLDGTLPSEVDRAGRVERNGRDVIEALGDRPDPRRFRFGALGGQLNVQFSGQFRCRATGGRGDRATRELAGTAAARRSGVQSERTSSSSCLNSFRMTSLGESIGGLLLKGGVRVGLGGAEPGKDNRGFNRAGKHELRPKSYGTVSRSVRPGAILLAFRRPLIILLRRVLRTTTTSAA
jgi:hypothetical protein